MGNRQLGRLAKPRQHQPIPWSEFQAAVHKLSNWQRHQWAKAGYPGLHYAEMGGLAPFVGRVKP